MKLKLLRELSLVNSKKKKTDNSNGLNKILKLKLLEGLDSHVCWCENVLHMSLCSQN